MALSSMGITCGKSGTKAWPTHHLARLAAVETLGAAVHECHVHGDAAARLDGDGRGGGRAEGLVGEHDDLPLHVGGDERAERRAVDILYHEGLALYVRQRGVDVAGAKLHDPLLRDGVAWEGSPL